jgi:hypothetical protein
MIICRLEEINPLIRFQAVILKIYNIEEIKVLQSRRVKIQKL